MKSDINSYNNALAQWLDEQLTSDYRQDLRESELEDAEMKRRQQEAMINMLQSKSLATGTGTGTNKTLLIAGGVSLVLFVVILFLVKPKK
jgi:ABC-type hemin transport system substrate-binding protein